MTRRTFLDALAYLKRSDIAQVRLLGGEPTLHADVSWMLEQSLAQGFMLMVFSNGLMPEPVLQQMAAIPEKQIRILLNTIHPAEGNPSGMQRQQEVMQVLSRKVMLGANIYTRGQDLNYLIDYVDAFDLYPEIRIGIAHPVLSRRNRFLPPKFYTSVGTQLSEFLTDAEKCGMRVGLDCGFVPCMFPLERHHLLMSLLKRSGRCCNPTLDLLPDGRFIACYPLHHLSQYAMTPKTTARAVIEKFKMNGSPYRDIGIFSNCPTCQFFHTACNGGCLAQKINRVRVKRDDRSNSVQTP
jgi:radical SAM protein with 4Fe4S-binding SPASM domain